jgi:hypothetical protein
VSVLLRQPHCFEGLGAVPIKRKANDLAGIHREHRRSGRVHLGPARLAAGVDVVGHYNMLTALDEVIRGLSGSRPTR